VTRRTYLIDVDRVIVRGAGVDRVDVQELHGLVARAVAHELTDAALPPGRAMRAAVQIASRTAPDGAASIASAVASGIAQAAGRPTRG
jgi:hypothetical protein